MGRIVIADDRFQFTIKRCFAKKCHFNSSFGDFCKKMPLWLIIWRVLQKKCCFNSSSEDFCQKKCYFNWSSGDFCQKSAILIHNLPKMCCFNWLPGEILPKSLQLQAISRSINYGGIIVLRNDQFAANVEASPIVIVGESIISR